jgi:CDP-4-dehydro-6-deoxyglucose reductase
VLELRDAARAQSEAAPDDVGLQRLAKQATTGLARALATEPVDTLDIMDDMLKVMCAQVTVRPSGHQFAVEGHDTLLQAGLRAGLKLNYGCGNGSCGMCKVRVIDGAVARVQHTDYPLSEAEKAQGYTLMCAHTAASELTLETLEASGPQDIARSRSSPRCARCASWRPIRAAAPADAAQPPPALRRPIGDAGPERPRGERRPYTHAAGGELPLRRPQPALHVGRDESDAFARQVFAGALRATPSTCGARKATSCSRAASGRWSSPPATSASRR